MLNRGYVFAIEKAVDRSLGKKGIDFEKTASGLLPIRYQDSKRDSVTFSLASVFAFKHFSSSITRLLGHKNLMLVMKS